MVLHNISRNDINKIQKSALIGLKELQIIDLSYNKISFITSNMFLGVESLKFFRFYGNNIKIIDDLTFKHLISLKFIMTNDSSVCCVKLCSNIICSKAHIDPYICQGLIIDEIVIIIMFVTAFALIVSNLISLCKLTHLDMQSISKSTCFEVIAKYLHLSDLSYAMYLVFITVGNTYLKISPVAKAFYWTSHAVCYFSCVLYIYFQMTSVGIILFLALARWLVAKYPLTSRLKHISFSTKCLRYILATLLIFSVSITLYFLLRFISAT